MMRVYVVCLIPSRSKSGQPLVEVGALGSHGIEADLAAMIGPMVHFALEPYSGNTLPDPLGRGGSLAIVDQFWIGELLRQSHKGLDCPLTMRVVAGECKRIGEEEGFELVQLNIGDESRVGNVLV